MRRLRFTSDHTYFLTVVALVGFGLRPGGRTWALDHWAYWGGAIPIVLGALFVALPFFATRLTLALGWIPRRQGRTIWVTFAWMGLATALFSLLRTRTHFLGDGYQTIALLASDPPFVKGTVPLLAKALPAVRDWFGADPRGAALRAYRALAIGCGLLFIVAIAVFSRAMTKDRLERVLLSALLMTGGYMFLFFGYVENYAPLVTFVGITCMAGVLVLAGKVRRAGVLVPALLAVWSHGVGLLVAPATIYVLLAGTKAERSWNGFPRWIRGGIAGSAAIGAALALWEIGRRNVAVHLAVLPVVPTWRVLEGYTLFSGAHLADLANLIFLLFPGVGVVGTMLLVGRGKSSLSPQHHRFLALFVGSCWSGVAILGPALGMPRDWDLFAFAGAPLVVAAGLMALHAGAPRKTSTRTLLLASALGVGVLGARIGEGLVPMVAAERFRSYLDLDVAKARVGRHALATRYREWGKHRLADAQFDRYERDYPEIELVVRASDLQASGRGAEAIELCYEALAINSGARDAYLILGEELWARGDHEEAIVMSKRAHALSADPVRSAHSVAAASASLGRYDDAEAWWHRALATDSTSYVANLSLAHLYLGLNRRTEAMAPLRRAARSAAATPEVVAQARELGAIE